MSRYDANLNLLKASFVELKPKDKVLKRGFSYYLGHAFLSLYYMVGLVKLEIRDDSDSPPRKGRGRSSKKSEIRDDTEQRVYFPSEKFTHCSNLTLLNLVLVCFGPMSERDLCNRVLAIQVLCGTFFPFLIRYGLVGMIY
jgi:hypothetical protein